MALSNIKFIVSDGNLGIVSPSGAENVVKVGVCTAGVPGTFLVHSNLTNVPKVLGLGALTENVAYALNVSGGPVSSLAITPSQPGSVGSVTHSGTGAGTVTVSKAPHEQVIITIAGGGVNDTATFYFQVGSDGYSAAQIVPGAPDGYTFLVPGTYTVLTFAQGTYVANDYYTISTTGTVTKVGTSPNITQASSPIDDYSVVVTVDATDGGVGTARFTYSLDNGTTVSPPIVTAAKYAIPNSGVVLAFASTFVAGDTYSFLCCGPTFSSSDMLAAIDALNLATPFSLLHVDNKSVSASAAYTFSTIVDEACSTLFDEAMFVRAVCQTPRVGALGGFSGSVFTSIGSLGQSTETIASTESAWLNQVSTRIGAGANDCLIASPLNGLVLRRNTAWALMARVGAIDPATDAAELVLGGLQGVSGISDDEALDEGLSDAGFTTLRTWIGRPGFYVNDALTMASKIQSDYSELDDARVIDLACNITRQAALPLIRTKIAANSNGTIQESAAKGIEAKLNNALLAGLVTVQPQQAVGARAIVDRTNNIVSTGTLQITVSVQKFAYAKNITVTIGFGL